MHMHCFKMGLKMFKWVQGGSVLQSYFEVSPKLLGFGPCPGVLKVMFTKFGDKCVNDWICFKVM